MLSPHSLVDFSALLVTSSKQNFRMFILSMLLLAVVARASPDYLLLDIKEASTEKINEALKDVNVEYKFKEKAVLRHIIVIDLRKTTLEQLSNVSIPGKSSSIPAEDEVDTMSRLNVTWPRKELTDANLTLFERTLYLTDETSEQYLAQLKAFGEQTKDYLEYYDYKAFRAAGAYPPKSYYFVNLPRENLDEPCDQSIDIWGGPGGQEISVHYMHKLN